MDVVVAPTVVVERVGSGRRRCSGPRGREGTISMVVMVVTVVSSVVVVVSKVVVERVGVAGWSAEVASVHRLVVGRRHGRTVVAVGLVDCVCVVCAR